MRYAVEAWAPEYGSAGGPESMEESQAPVDVGAEVAAGSWEPIRPTPDGPVPHEVAFVDGVRRVEARVWVTDDAGATQQGLCASYAAGVVRCNGAATVVDAEVRRSLFCQGSGLVPIETRHGRFGVQPVASDSPDALSLALQGAMGDLESVVSREVDADCLLVVDGPLRDRTDLDDAVGYVKTHHVGYLPAVVADVVTALEPGERTPVFLVGDRFRRWSWYLRLPLTDLAHGWAGIVRCEVRPDHTVADVVGVADACARLLPRFASAAHKDGRAPQNLYPIAGLERELRRRLGDHQLLYRALRAAA